VSDPPLHDASWNDAPVQRLLSRAAVIATATVFGMTYGLSATLIALDLAERGVTEWLIGVNAGMYALGVLIIAPVLPRVVGPVGARALIVGALVLAAVVLALFPAAPALWLWFPLRLVLGMASEALFVLSETWINHLSSDQTRARVMATYTASLSLGFAGGPLILSVVGSEGATAYLVGAGLALAATALVACPWVAAPTFDEPAASHPLVYLRLAPIAIAATVLNAALETAGLSFLALYALSAGWAEQDATRLITAMMVGAIALQLPIGWLGDKVDRMKLVQALSWIAAAGALVWPLVLHQRALAYVTVFVWGGVFVGIYTIMLTVVGSRFKGSELVGIYSVMGLAFGIGALAGPALAGIAMDLTTHGLPLFAAAACLTFAVFVLCLRSAPQGRPGTTQGSPGTAAQYPGELKGPPG
jgi:MFS family permease